MTDRIAKFLRKKKILTTFGTTSKIRQVLRSAKEPIDKLGVTGVYKIPCECGKVYIGVTGRSVNTMICEHKRSLGLMQLEKFATAEHALNENHEILFEQAEILVRTNGFYDLSRLEAMEIAQHPFVTRDGISVKHDDLFL